MIEVTDVEAAYATLLLRRPDPGDVVALRAGAADVRWLDAELRGSVEYRSIVRPLRELLEREWQHWAMRPPTLAELTRGVDATRGLCGSDDAVRLALADGSIRRKLGFRPLKIEMDITNQCNLRCVMCHFSLPEYQQAPRQHITEAQFGDIASQLFHRASQVALSYGTEPLLHRELPRLLTELARHGVPHTYLHTNGLLLTEAHVEAMLDTGFSVLFVSVDAATRATYESIRIGGSFARLRERLAMLARQKERRGSRTPALTLGFVIMRQNLHELPAMIDFAAEVGATAVNATHMAAWESVGNARFAVAEDKARCNEAIAAARARAAVCGIRFVAPPPFVLAASAATEVASPPPDARFGLDQTIAPAAPCPFPWSFVAIDPKGFVLPCGWWDQALSGPMGNVFTTDFAAIWHGEAYRALRARHMARQFSGPCAQCPAAGMGHVDTPASFAPAS